MPIYKHDVKKGVNGIKFLLVYDNTWFKINHQNYTFYNEIRLYA